MYNTIYPGYVQSYYNINHNQIKKKEDSEKNAQSSGNAERNNYDASSDSKQSSGRFYFPNGEKTAVDYNKKQIGIDQILQDFRNTASAIGAPDDVKSEVSSYLNLAENQSLKENPDSEIIRSNLKNASKILDEFITNTLKKPSKVVSEWVNTLFLQPVDLKSQKIQEAVKEETPAETKEEITEERQPKTDAAAQEQLEKNETPSAEKIEQTAPKQTPPEIYTPDDAKLKRMFIQAKKYAAIDRKQDALAGFKKAMDYAEAIGDDRTQAMLHFEEGNIYNDFNRPEEALYNYAIAALQTEDNSLKARAYLSMGKIYDDNVYFEPALQHYSAAAGYAGEADNLKIQCKALSDLAKLHAQRYDADKAGVFMDLASVCAESSDDEKVKGVIYSKNAKMCSGLGERSKALSSYGKSAQAFANLGDYENLAKDYREAAIIMRGYGNTAKAKTLLSKALSAARAADNTELKMLIMQDLEKV